MANILMQANGFDFEIRKEKNLRMDGRYIVIEFEDAYQNYLVTVYGWAEEDAENRVDRILEDKLRKLGIDVQLIWEDREVFLIGNPAISVEQLADGFKEVFPGATAVKQRGGGLLERFFRRE